MYNDYENDNNIVNEPRDGNMMKQLTRKRWQPTEPMSKEAEALARELNISAITAQLLCKRGITTAEEGAAFLRASTEEMHSPFLLKGMDIAVERILRALKEEESIIVYGDYDVDGITATALLFRFLSRLTEHVGYYIPERQSEGYGLNVEALKHLAEDGANLVITVDCGISSFDIVEEMKALVDIIITDHHTPPNQIPLAVAVINPKQEGCPYPDKNLAGAGVAFKLCQALWGKLTDELYLDDIDIAALGTIADVVPLIGENRIIAKAGLAKMTHSPNLGLKELISVAGLENRTITAGHVGFSLAPRLNAAGRVTHATRGVVLLTTEDGDEARAIAEELQETNVERQQIERAIHEEARLEVARQGELADKVLVVAGDDWHSGVIGIVASRLVEEYYKPAIMISLNEGVGKASCRSIDGFDMYEALKYCEDLLLQFGGHKQAAGFSIVEENIPLLRERLVTYCTTHLSPEDYVPQVKIDLPLSVEEVTIELIDELSALEPFGMCNSTPVFAIKELAVANLFVLGYQRNHIKFILEKDHASVEALAWNGSDYQTSIFRGNHVKIAFTLQKNEWQGQEIPQLILQDIQVLEKMNPKLDRDKLSHVYRVLKNFFKMKEYPRYIVEAEMAQQHIEGCSPLEIMLALEVFKELGIIEEMSTEKGAIYQWCAVNGKLDLVTSVTYLHYS